MKDAAIYLRHIRDAIARIEKYTVQGRKAFFNDTMVQDGVIRSLFIFSLRSQAPVTAGFRVRPEMTTCLREGV